MATTTELNVSLIASSKIKKDAIENHLVSPMEVDEKASDGATLAEFAGRSCYKSFHRPNESTREVKDYIKSIMAKGHGSVLEHATATVFITGVSRSLTHELVRHRMFSYSELSQRFVDMSDTGIVIPPALEDDLERAAVLGLAKDNLTDAYNNIVEALTEQGYKKKQAKEAARSVLPSMMETRIVVTGNARGWRDFLLRRGSAAADAEIQRLAFAVYEVLNKEWPEFLQDFRIENGELVCDYERV